MSGFLEGWKAGCIEEWLLGEWGEVSGFLEGWKAGCIEEWLLGE